MSDVMAKLDLIHRDLLALQERLSAADATPLFAPLTVAQFAEKVGRGADWVYDQIRLKRVAVLPGGKPYRIPPDQLTKFFAPGRN